LIGHWRTFPEFFLTLSSVYLDIKIPIPTAIVIKAASTPDDLGYVEELSHSLVTIKCD